MAASSSADCDLGERERHLLDLPNELIEHVLLDNCIQFTDVCSAAKACTKLQYLCQSNELWKQKLRQRWPKLLSRYRRNHTYNWCQEVKKCHIVGKKVRHLVQELSPRFYKVEEISKEGFRSFDVLIEEYNSEEVVVNELMELIHDKRSKENLTTKYYAAKALRYIQHNHLRTKWREHLDQPHDEQKPEIGAVMIAQWCQPTVNITENEICDQLDNLAKEVKCRCSDAISTMYNKCNSESPYPAFSPQQQRSILETLNEVLYNVHRFAGNAGDYYDERNSYIDQVLTRHLGIPITLSIVYSAIASRLGVVCEFVNFPGHFLLKWKEHPMAKFDQQYTYIDAFNSGRLLAQSELANAFNLRQELVDNPDVCRSIELSKHVLPIHDEGKIILTMFLVYERMARNLINIGRQQGRVGDSLLCLRNAVELFLLINPDDVETILLQVRLFLHLNINLADVRDSLQRIADLDQSRMGLVAYLMSSAETHMLEYEASRSQPIEQKHRKDNPEVQFSVGMVMKHKRYHYMCVVYGWDSTCQASQEWIEQMGVPNLPKKQYQPFYNVLVEDESNRYAAQENLYLPDEPEIVIPHPDVGKYFKEFSGTYYLLNDEKQSEYPDDFVVTKELTDKHFEQR